ncbi:MAG: DinB family protein [Maribacter sp.]|uniref:DinB family protein n=1 Tax=Maribacter sp. TaxID=1897614 RepID=UPI0032983AB7
MASFIVTPENQIQRLNSVLHKVNELRLLDNHQLMTPPNSKAWSVVETIEHLNIAYQLYIDKIDTTLVNLPCKENTDTSFKVRWWQRFVIDSTRPKNNKRKMKMKTLKRFEPVLEIAKLDQDAMEAIFERFEKLHLHLKNAIVESRSKNSSKLKISSAIGPIVSFYLPECFEFLLAHIERHMLQIDEIIQKGVL